MPRFQPPRATRDFLPHETAARDYVRAQFAQAAKSYGFQAIETPTFENVELFLARSGPEIKSSMLTFHCDHEEFALRPEMTAPVCRLMASGAFDAFPKPYKLYYIAPCFRYCRPQPGRFREFTQAGIEYLGEPGPAADAEVIAAACHILRSIGIQEFNLKIGNIAVFGSLLAADLDPEDRAVVIGHLDRLIAIDEKCALLRQTGDSALRSELNMDRMELAALQAEVDYSGPHAIAERADVTPFELAELLPKEAEATFRRLWSVQDLVGEDVSELLVRVSRLRGPLSEVHQQAQALLEGTRAMGALDELLSVCRHVEMYDPGSFEVVLGIARGFTFYTSTVFEISSSAGNGGKKYCGGGRYDRLVEEFGGPPLPSTGCAFRFDSLVDDFLALNDAWATPPAHQLYFLAESHEVLPVAIRAAESLRSRGLRVGVGVGSQSTPSVKDCQERQTEWIALLGGADAAQERVRLCDGSKSEIVPLDPEALASKMRQTAGE